MAVRLVVEREREIKAFVPEEFWEIDANTTTPGGDALPLEVTHQNDKPFRPVNREQTLAAVSLLEKARYSVLEREDKPTSSKPSAPFITSTLQQAASTRLGFGVKKTMMMAQRLYEAGYITYMRTDSTNLSQDAVTMFAITSVIILAKNICRRARTSTPAKRTRRKHTKLSVLPMSPYWRSR